jgi:hypothetical protein
LAENPFEEQYMGAVENMPRAMGFLIAPASPFLGPRGLLIAIQLVTRKALRIQPGRSADLPDNLPSTHMVRRLWRAWFAFTMKLARRWQASLSNRDTGRHDSKYALPPVWNHLLLSAPRPISGGVCGVLLQRCAMLPVLCNVNFGYAEGRSGKADGSKGFTSSPATVLALPLPATRWIFLVLSC